MQQQHTRGNILFVSHRTSNLEDLVKGIKTLAALMDDDDRSNGLLDAARGLANAFSDLLNSLKPGEGKVGTSYQRIYQKV